MQPLQIIYQCKCFRMFCLIKIVSLQVFYSQGQADLKAQNDRRPFVQTYHVSNLTAQQNYCMTSFTKHQSSKPCGGFPYSYWLFCNFPVKFDNQKFSDACYDEGHCGKSILKKMHISHSVFMSNARGVFRPNLRAIHQIFTPYKFIERKCTLAKAKSLFSASKVL